MKSIFIGVVLLLFLPIHSALAQEAEEPTSKFLLGLSVKATGSNLVDFKLFDFRAMKGSQKCFTFNTDLQYNLNERIFITTGVGVSNLNFTGTDRTTFQYTEAGNLSASPNTIIQPYNIQLGNDYFNHALAFNLVTQKEGDLFDQMEGDALFAKYFWEMESWYLNFPLLLNYKIQLNKIAIYAGIGPSFQVQLTEKVRTLKKPGSYYIINSTEDPFDHDFDWNERNEVGEINDEYQSSINNFLVEANFKLGLIKELRNNLFILDAVYGRTLNGFTDEKNLETLGVQVSWRTRI